MLENEGEGQRSGVSPVCGLLRSQKKAKVRCWTVSSSASIRAGAGPGPGAVAGVEQAKTIEPARAKRYPGRARSGAKAGVMWERSRGAPESPAPRGAIGQKVYSPPSWTRRGAGAPQVGALAT